MEVQIENLTNSATGTTTATAVAAVTLDTRGLGTQGKTVFVINNTHASNTMYYQINGYVHPNSTYYVPVKAQTSIAASTSHRRSWRSGSCTATRASGSTRKVCVQCRCMAIS